MWKRLRERHPRVYEAVEWFTLGLSLVAVVLAGLTVWTSALA